jgi:CubicO group peptidase (beta-lactamase class C family)
MKHWTMSPWRATLAALLLAAGAALAQAPQSQVGPQDADFAGVDLLAQQHLARYGLPGVSLVVAWGDRIVYAQGYGWANRERQVPTSPWLEYRLASVSKTITAAAIMKLVEQRKLNLDASAWDLIASAMAVTPADARVRQVTVRQLLTHSWGLDRSVAEDPFGSYYVDGSKVVNSCRDMLRYRLQRITLNFAPGARYAYNNHGYCWLQVIAEVVDGRPLETQVTAMMGTDNLSSGRFRLGSTLPSAITEAEVRAYDYTGAPTAAPVPGLYPNPAPLRVARPDGQYTLTGYGGSGGFIASPITLMRFIQRLQGLRQPALLAPDIWQQMQTEQPLADGTRYAGLGVQTILAWPGSPDRWYSFNGNILGTRTAWLSTPRTPGGPMLSIVMMVNGSRTWPGDGLAEDNPFTELAYPVLTELDRIGAIKLAAKREILPDRLIAWGSSTEAYFIDELFDWGQRVLPSMFPGPKASAMFERYRYRYYPETGNYLGARDGRIVLYQPSVSPTINDLAAILDYLPQAVRDNDLARAAAARGVPAR